MVRPRPARLVTAFLPPSPPLATLDALTSGATLPAGAGYQMPGRLAGHRAVSRGDPSVALPVPPRPDRPDRPAPSSCEVNLAAMTAPLPTAESDRRKIWRVLSGVPPDGAPLRAVSGRGDGAPGRLPPP
jgi:hypothetical protein